MRAAPGSRAEAFEIAGGELHGEIRGGVARVILNRPAVLNALSGAMIRGLAEWMEAFVADDRVRIVVLRGAGGKAFCAGGDVRAVYRGMDDRAALEAFFRDEYALDHRIHTFPKPVVAFLDGIVMGGGMGLTQGAALRVVGERTAMAMPETALGFFPDVGGSYFLSRAPGRIGLYLGLTGATIGAADALHAGLADFHLSPAALERFDASLESAAASADPASAVRALARASASAPAAGTLERLRDEIETHFANPGVGAIVDSLEGARSDDPGQWRARTLEALQRASPTALEVTFEALRRGARLSLGDCFRMELGLVGASLDQGDFREGIRARLVDKDNRPRWRPATLPEVTRDSIEAFFAPRWSASEHPLAHLQP